MGDATRFMEHPQSGYSGRAIPPDEIVARFVTDDGTATGAYEMIGNYSDAGLGVTKFWFEHTSPVLLFRMIVHITDNVNLSADGYAGAGTLTNGLKVSIEDANQVEVLDLMDGHNLFNLADWAKFSYDGRADAFGSGDNSFNVRWTFANFGGPIYLPAGYRFTWTLNDDFSALVEHTAYLNGEVAP